MRSVNPRDYVPAREPMDAAKFVRRLARADLETAILYLAATHAECASCDDDDEIARVIATAIDGEEAFHAYNETQRAEG